MENSEFMQDVNALDTSQSNASEKWQNGNESRSIEEKIPLEKDVEYQIKIDNEDKNAAKTLQVKENQNQINEKKVELNENI